MVHLYVSLVSVITRLSERVRADDEGATAVEYGLMVALIAAVIVGTVFTLGHKVDDAFQTIVGQL